MLKKQILLSLVVLITMLYGFPALSKQSNTATFKPLLVKSQNNTRLASTSNNLSVLPLEKLVLIGAEGKTLTVTDSKGNTYVTIPIQTQTAFIAGGNIGIQTLKVIDAKGLTNYSTSFMLTAETNVNDGGNYSELFKLLYKGMCVYAPKGYDSTVYKDKTYHWFVNWGLDNYHTGKGMQYFSSYWNEHLDLFEQVQRKDGMIWSFVDQNDAPGYYETAYGPSGYVMRDVDNKTFFVRQPTENHPEYLYVSTIYQAWKGSGNFEWMKNKLASAARALNYTVNDRSRWSNRFQLLKRPYTIDSWDFQINDKYTPQLGLNNTMLIDPDKTKFGVFFGDNLGYAVACEQLSEMYTLTANTIQAEIYANRAKEIRQRLNNLAWNGNFFTHFIDEDSTVKRDVGVDEKSQIGHSNAYVINRGISHEQSVAIINTYINLKNNLPVGSPAEWYAIYPPFEKGFGTHNEKWQYMNGGIAGHAAGELARGAFENGYESYGADIMLRLLNLGKKYGNRIWFAYTGSYPTPPTPIFKTIDLKKQANMDFWDQSSTKSFMWLDAQEKGNDLRNIPLGEQNFEGVKYSIIDPAKNNRCAAVAVSSRKGFPTSTIIPINDTAITIYLLHAANFVGSENVCGSLTFQYADGSQQVQYIIKDKHLSGWWFPELKRKEAGVAWFGSSPVCLKVGVSWAAIKNPNPEKLIKNITINATVDNTIYAILGITLSNQNHYVRPKGESFGGPDNWAAATAMCALIEGQAGIRDLNDVAYNKVRIAPRWSAAGVDSIAVTTVYPASNGYVSYLYQNLLAQKCINIAITGSGSMASFEVLLPAGIKAIKQATYNKIEIQHTINKIENSYYACFTINNLMPSEIVIQY